LDKKPFEGIKVIELCWSGVGPFTANLLAHYGATMVRVESATQPDPIRLFWAYTDVKRPDEPNALERSMYFPFSHPAPKYGMSLNLKHPRAVGLFKKLVEWADVVVESFPTGRVEKLGLAYDDLVKVKPDIIMLRTCGYGHTGPMAEQPGFGMTIGAVSGMCTIAGWPDLGPVPLSSYYTDQLSPLMAMASLVAAVDYHRRTGKGQCIDHSQIEAGLTYLAPVLLDYTVNKRNLTLTGNKCSYAAPHGVYPCKGEDRWVAIAVTNDIEWKSFCNVVENPEWTKDPKFGTMENRIANSDELDQHVASWTINFSSEHVQATLQGVGVGAGVVKDSKDVAEDPAWNHYEFNRELDHPYIGKKKFYHPPAMKLSNAPPDVGRPVLIGEHNDYVCTKILGLSDDEFVELLVDGVFE
jgi:benzylsuccinate CoA-transferase BbsF subunit